jgi:hypothetical protein
MFRSISLMVALVAASAGFSYLGWRQMSSQTSPERKLDPNALRGWQSSGGGGDSCYEEFEESCCDITDGNGNLDCWTRCDSGGQCELHNGQYICFVPNQAQPSTCNGIYAYTAGGYPSGWESEVAGGEDDLVWCYVYNYCTCAPRQKYDGKLGCVVGDPWVESDWFPQTFGDGGDCPSSR